MKEQRIVFNTLNKKNQNSFDKLPMFERTEVSWKKFRVENTNQEFFYSNYDNGLYDIEKNPLSEVVVPDENYKSAIQETRSLIKSNEPFWIRILLGHACNYSCTYCLQKDIGNPDERSKIETTDYFIEQIKKLNLSKVEKIDLWGGETLLYWKTIEVLMKELDRENLKWFIPTNGTTLQMKHVDFFKSLKGTVGIGLSHDGPGHTKLRGPEFLHKKIDVLKSLQENNISFSFNVVISKENYDLFEINDFFYNFCIKNELDISKVRLSLTVARNYDYENIHNSAENVIGGESLKKFNIILRDYLDKCIEQFFYKKDHKLLSNSLFNGELGIVNYASTLKKQILPTITTSCGVDDQRVLSVDIKGNVRTCPHVDETFIGGSLEKIEEVKLKNLDLQRYENHCKSCPVYRLCKSSCPIKVPDEVFYSNCAIEKVFWRAVQEKAFKLLFKSEVSLIE